jgi:hypothetical protein
MRKQFGVSWVQLHSELTWTAPRATVSLRPAQEEPTSLCFRSCSSLVKNELVKKKERSSEAGTRPDARWTVPTTNAAALPARVRLPFRSDLNTIIRLIKAQMPKRGNIVKSAIRLRNSGLVYCHPRH